MNGHIGIQTNNPQKALNLHGVNDTICGDVTMRLSFGTVADPSYMGHISLLTGATLNSYTTIPSRGVGDIVIQANNQRTGGNIILTTLDTSKSIIFATHSPIRGELERQKIFPTGRIDFNIGQWDYGFPKIVFQEKFCHPSIRFYRPTGGDISSDARSFNWWIEATDTSVGQLNFRSGPNAKVGQEIVSTKVTFLNNGNVGINNSLPVSKFQVTDGSVLFNGTTGTTPTSGAGTRFMWIPDKGAIRAGKVDGTQWDDSNIGAYSTAFGFNNIASGIYSVAIGKTNETNGPNTFAIGYGNKSYTDLSFSYGCGNQTESRGFSYGILCKAGGNPYPESDPSFSFGYYSNSIGCATFTIGCWLNSENYRGAMILSDNPRPPAGLWADYDYTTPTNDNQLTLRFTGKGNDNTKENVVFRLITSVNENLGSIQEICAYHNGYGFVSTSDSNCKKDILPVDINNVLYGLKNVPIKTWKWKNNIFYNSDSISVIDSLSYTWIGPMAQDFYHEFPLGIPDSTKISWSVLDGVMMASIQALANITDTLKESVNNSWSKTGNSITSNNFLGTVNAQPLIIKVNSQEKMNISENQLTLKFNGFEGEPNEENAALRFYSDSTLQIGVFMPAGQSGWNVISDKNRKEDFEDIEFDKLLNSIDNIPVTTWRYKNTSKSIRYIGPMSQDIYNEFKLGDSMSINSINIDGINFAGVKALIKANKKIEDKMSNLVTKEELNSFKDTIHCYKEACDRIKKLGEIVKDLQKQIDSLKSNNGGKTEDKEKSDEILYNFDYNDVILEQNRPNPFAETSEINYYIPKKYSGQAKLLVTDESGKQILQDFAICIGKPCQLVISARELPTGVYIYGINIENKNVIFKKMMVIK